MFCMRRLVSLFPDSQTISPPGKNWHGAFLTVLMRSCFRLLQHLWMAAKRDGFSCQVGHLLPAWYSTITQVCVQLGSFCPHRFVDSQRSQCSRMIRFWTLSGIHPLQLYRNLRKDTAVHWNSIGICLNDACVCALFVHTHMYGAQNSMSDIFIQCQGLVTCHHTSVLLL